MSNRIPQAFAALALALPLALGTMTATAEDAPPPATVTPAAPGERPAYCPDAPAPCYGVEDEYIDADMPLEFDGDGRPVNCPPYPGVCAVPGYEDGPPYPQNYDPEGNPLPTGPAEAPSTTAPKPEPVATAPATTAPKPELVTPSATDQAPGLPTAGV